MNIEHIALNVPDPPAQAEWYVQHLGMRVLRRVEGPPHTHFLADAAGRVVLEIYCQTIAPIPDYAGLDPLVLHIAFLADDLEATLRRLCAAGATVAVEPTPTPAGDVLAMLRDPWGVAIQFVKRHQPLLTGIG